MIVDVHGYLGPYPYRSVPGTEPRDLLLAMDRVGIDEAWVTHLPSLFWADPMEGQADLYRSVAGEPRLHPVPAIHPGLPGWEAALDQAVAHRVPAVRCDPTRFGLDPACRELGALFERCRSVGLPVLTAVRLEDARQRHPLDQAPDLEPWAVRAWLRHPAGPTLVVCGAGREFIDQVHFGSTPEESSRVWWDISWIWGPPEDDLAVLLQTVGVDRFVFGTGQPLKIPEGAGAKLDLVWPHPAGEWRRAVESGNLARATNRR